MYFSIVYPVGQATKAADVAEINYYTDVHIMKLTFLSQKQETGRMQKKFQQSTVFFLPLMLCICFTSTHLYNSAQMLLPTSCCLSIWPPEGLLHHLKALTVKQSSTERGLFQAICGEAMTCYILPVHQRGKQYSVLSGSHVFFQTHFCFSFRQAKTAWANCFISVLQP